MRHTGTTPTVDLGVFATDIGKILMLVGSNFLRRIALPKFNLSMRLTLGNAPYQKYWDATQNVIIMESFVQIMVNW
jgi:hypothetical protein